MLVVSHTNHCFDHDRQKKIADSGTVLREIDNSTVCVFYSTNNRSSSFTETCSGQESRLQRHSTRPVQVDESPYVPGFIAQRQAEKHFWVQGNVCVKFRLLACRASLFGRG
ncbi:hypothetical protein [Tychonema sp. LEGE 07203]|uniref:hypothetical protein n=1 Tax=Tychonema sp. LEGE 07203 TaxID=1828671 RepID=UPI00187FE9FD|nr:hypothetical protein [Tychonema sp. LEGE 07203]MBE9094824.1 hypothetical protein [Tychonema sp. LEGE 07203]